MPLSIGGRRRAGGARRNIGQWDSEWAGDHAAAAASRPNIDCLSRSASQYTTSPPVGETCHAARRTRPLSDNETALDAVLHADRAMLTSSVMTVMTERQCPLQK